MASSKKEQAQVDLKTLDDSEIMKIYDKFATKKSTIKNPNKEKKSSTKVETKNDEVDSSSSSSSSNEETTPQMSKMQFYNRKIKRLNHGYSKFI